MCFWSFPSNSHFWVTTSKYFNTLKNSILPCPSQIYKTKKQIISIQISFELEYSNYFLNQILLSLILSFQEKFYASNICFKMPTTNKKTEASCRVSGNSQQNIFCGWLSNSYLRQTFCSILLNSSFDFNSFFFSTYKWLKHAVVKNSWLLIKRWERRLSIPRAVIFFSEILSLLRVRFLNLLY